MGDLSDGGFEVWGVLRCEFWKIDVAESAGGVGSLGGDSMGGWSCVREHEEFGSPGRLAKSSFGLLRSWAHGLS